MSVHPETHFMEIHLIVVLIRSDISFWTSSRTCIAAPGATSLVFLKDVRLWKIHIYRQLFRLLPAASCHSHATSSRWFPGLFKLNKKSSSLLVFPQVDGALWLSDWRSRKLQVQDQVHLADRGTVSRVTDPAPWEKNHIRTRLCNYYVVIIG